MDASTGGQIQFNNPENPEEVEDTQYPELSRVGAYLI